MFRVPVWPVRWAARCLSLSFRDSDAVTALDDVGAEGPRELPESDLVDEDSNNDWTSLEAALRRSARVATCLIGAISIM